MLQDKANKLNGKPKLLHERLTKVDSDLIDYAKKLGCKTTSYNSVPQLLVKKNVVVKNDNHVDQKDIDETYESGNVILRSSVAPPPPPPPNIPDAANVYSQGLFKILFQTKALLGNKTLHTAEKRLLVLSLIETANVIRNKQKCGDDMEVSESKEKEKEENCLFNEN